MVKCRAMDISAKPNDFRVCTVHPTSDESLNPVSTVKFGANKEVCFLTALKLGEPVTETCFVDLANPSNHTVKILQSVTLADAHKGLQPGQSMQYFSMQSGEHSCASFIQAEA